MSTSANFSLNNAPNFSIRAYQDRDWEAVCEMLRAIIRSGEVYAFAPETSDEEIHRIWIETPQATYVAVDEATGQVLGTYYLKPNQPGLGSHVANAGYAVAQSAQGRGIAAAMCEHSQDQARQLGFLSMQFNFVVSTNQRAVKLWLRHGFAIIGTLPNAFQHATLGLVDVHVMFKELRPARSESA